MQNLINPLKTVIIFFVFLEGFFWIGGGISQLTHLVTSKQALSHKDKYVIVCVGESLTLVGGEDSYPSQLQKILDEKFGKDKFQVINEGAAGKGTDYFSRHINDIISNYHPDMVISMTGILDPVTAEIKKQSKEFQFLKKLKLCRLYEQMYEKVRLGWTAFTEKQRKQMRYFAKPEIVVPKEEVSQEVRNNVARLVIVAQKFESVKDYRSAEMVYDKLKEVNGKYHVVDDGWLRRKVGLMVLGQKNYDKFVDMMKDLPWDSWDVQWIPAYCHGEKNTSHVRDIIESIVKDKPEDFVVYGYLAQCYQNDGNVRMAEKYFNIIRQHKDSYYTDITKTNYRQFLSVLVEKNIQPVLVQYPTRAIAPLKELFKPQGYYDKIIFVDNEQVFGNTSENSVYQEYFSDRTFGDMGHMTPRGNRLLAENIYKESSGRFAAASVSLQ